MPLASLKKSGNEINCRPDFKVILIIHRVIWDKVFKNT